MRSITSLLLGLVALSLALTATPAAAVAERHEGFRGRPRVERQEHARPEHERQARGREDHDRWEHHDFRFAYPVPYVAPYCYTQDGYWAWDGWQYAWVPPQTVCQ